MVPTASSPFSLHDALPISAWAAAIAGPVVFLGSVFQYVSFDYLWWVLAAWIIIRLLKSENQRWWLALGVVVGLGDRKSTRLNSSHLGISYAVFCLKKKTKS